MSKCKDNAVVPLRESNEPERLAIAAVLDNRPRRRHRVSLTVASQKEGVLGISSPHAGQNGWAVRMDEAFGTTSHDFAAMATTQLSRVTAARGVALTEVDLNAALAFVDGSAREMKSRPAWQSVCTHRTSLAWIC